MKKTLSLFMSFVMLLSSLTFSAVNAFAYSEDTAPEVVLDEVFSVTVPFTDMNTYDPETMDQDAVFAKFTPEATSFYEFKFEQKFSGTDEEATLVYIVDGASKDVLSEALCTKITKNNKEYAALLGISENMSVSAKMTAGKTYLLYIISTVSGGFTSNVTVQTHTHKTKLVTEKSYVDSDSFKNNYDGEKYYCCTSNNCPYHKAVEKYYKVKSVKLNTTSYTVNGKAKKPTATVVTSKGKKMKQGTDYTISYSNNTKVGSAKATIKFRGKYTGKVVRKFKINPKGTSITSLYPGKNAFGVYWERNMDQTTGYQIQYSTDKKFKKGNKTVTIDRNTRRTKTIGSLKAKKTYYVRIRTYKTVGKTKYYSTWSKAKSIKTK